MVLKLTNGADSARADDTSVLKTTIMNWFNEVEVPNPHLFPYDKLGHSFHNLIAGRHLCPVEYDWENSQ